MRDMHAGVLEQVEQISRALDTWRRDLRQGKPASLPVPGNFHLGPQGEQYYNELVRGAGGSDMPAAKARAGGGLAASQTREQGLAGADGASAATWASSLPDVFGAANSATRKAERGFGKALRAFSGELGSKLF